MTSQDIHNEIEPDRTVGDRNNSKSKEGAVVLDAQVAGQPIKQPTSLEKFCDDNPGASQCRVYDL